MIATTSPSTTSINMSELLTPSVLDASERVDTMGVVKPGKLVSTTPAIRATLPSGDRAREPLAAVDAPRASIIPSRDLASEEPFRSTAMD